MAANAGLRPYGLHLESRVAAWKALVLPHIDFYLPFIRDTDLPVLQNTVNTTLRTITFTGVSPPALHAKFGIPDLKWRRAEALGILGGRLQFPPQHLQAAAIFTAQLANNPDSPPRDLCHEYKVALHLLELKDHWPLLQPHLLPSSEEGVDLPIEDPFCPDSDDRVNLNHTRSQWAKLVRSQAAKQCNFGAEFLPSGAQSLAQTTGVLHTSLTF